MKKNRLFLYLSILIFGVLLTACAGGTGNPTSWPGVTVDMEREAIYVANNQHVYAVNLASGLEKWRFPQEADKVTFFAPPVLSSDDQLIVGGYDNLLYSLDPATGAQKWSFDGAENKYIAGSLVTEEQIFAPNSDNQLYALTLTGMLDWQFETEHDLWGAPVVEGEQIHLTSMDHHVYALNKNSGDLVWQTDDLGGAIAGAPTLSPDGVLYVGTFGNELVALDTSNGSELWRFKAENWVWSGPALVDGILYFGDLSGKLYALDAQDATPIWQVQPDSSEKRAISSTPLVTEDSVYFVTDGGALYAINAESGATRWSQTIEGRLYTAPVVAGETVLIAAVDADAILYAFDQNGAPKWQFAPEN